MNRAGRAGVKLQGLVRRFGPVRAVDGVSLDVAPGALVALLGPSGCGKSTLLRLVAGLERADEGHILIDGQDVTGRSARERPTAMVFQSYALFPTMTVARNVSFGLDVRRVPQPERRARVARALERVGLEAFADRPVTRLSGGQQQRVAVARALAVEPRVLLFDEPLSNLDVALRERTREELKGLQQELGITALYVTHDQEEAMAVADRIAVMRDGRIVQVGVPETLYGSPATVFVARFLGAANIVGPAIAARLAGEPAARGLRLAVRPDELQFSEDGVDVRVVSRRFLGVDVEWTVEIGDERLRMRTRGEAQAPAMARVTASAWRWVEDDEGGAPA